jgi:Fur family ferric uptake transcriptional regulator
LLEQIFELLKQYDLRVTPQRKAILEILYNCRGHHLETENIYQLLSIDPDKKRKAGLATVYRTMEMFEKVGLVSRLSMEDSPSRYELVLPQEISHHHLICLKCGRVQELDDVLTEEFKQIVLESKDFMVTEKPIKIFGYCGGCRS